MAWGCRLTEMWTYRVWCAKKEGDILAKVLDVARDDNYSA